MIDVHAHVLPAVDDGARSRDEALAMLREAAAAGVTTLVATPHLYRPGEDRGRINDAYAQLVPDAEALGIRLVLGHEVNIGAMDALARAEAYCFSLPGDARRYLLLELDPDTPVDDASFLVSGIARMGIQPLIAHPERWLPAQANIQALAELRAYGGIPQVDARALSRSPLSRERRTAMRLYRADMIGCIASDAHRPGDYARFGSVIRRLGAAYADLSRA